MSDIIGFVSSAMASGVIGNAVYDGIKSILGDRFDRFQNYLTDKQQSKFEGALESLLEENAEIKQKLNELMKQHGKEIIRTNNIKNIVNGNIYGVQNVGSDANVEQIFIFNKKKRII